MLHIFIGYLYDTINFSPRYLRYLKKGVITDKTVLTITRPNFGRIVHPNSSGAHTLGPFECTGQAAVSGSSNGMPTSSKDLREERWI